MKPLKTKVDKKFIKMFNDGEITRDEMFKLNNEAKELRHQENALIVYDFMLKQRIYKIMCRLDQPTRVALNRLVKQGKLVHLQKDDVAFERYCLAECEESARQEQEKEKSDYLESKKTIFSH